MSIFKKVPQIFLSSYERDKDIADGIDYGLYEFGKRMIRDVRALEFKKNLKNEKLCLPLTKNGLDFKICYYVSETI